MPFLAFFVASDRASFDSTLGRMSMWSALDILTPIGTVNVDQEGQKRFLILPLSLSTLWWTDSSDVPAQEYEQKVVWITPEDEEMDFTSVVRFSFTTAPFHRIQNHTGPLPLKTTGLHRLILKFRAVGADEWEDVAEYPLYVIDPPTQADLDVTHQSSEGPTE